MSVFTLHKWNYLLQQICYMHLAPVSGHMETKSTASDLHFSELGFVELKMQQEHILMLLQSKSFWHQIANQHFKVFRNLFFFPR